MDKEEILLKEYEVCEEDNAGNFQGYWTLAAIFFGISSALLAGLIYGVLSNEHIFNALFYNNEPKKTLTVGIIAIVLAIANIIVLKKLKGWHGRIMFNQGLNSERMREIELELGMSREWRKLAIDTWNEIVNAEKKEATDNQNRWNILKNKLKCNIKTKYKGKLDTRLNKRKVEILELIDKYFQDGKTKDRHSKYEPSSSTKHFPCILHTLMFLWVLVIASAACLMLVVNNHFNWGWSLFVIIIAIWLSIVIFWNKKCLCIKKICNKLKEYFFDP